MYEEIKHPFAHLVKEDTNASVVMFDHDNKIHFFDDLPMNYPRWNFGCYDNENEALQRVEEMVNDEGWVLLETTEDSIKGLVE